MDLQFALSALGGIAVVLLLGIGAITSGADSRPGFLDDRHHN